MENLMLTGVVIVVFIIVVLMILNVYKNKKKQNIKILTRYKKLLDENNDSKILTRIYFDFQDEIKDAKGCNKEILSISSQLFDKIRLNSHLGS